MCYLLFLFNHFMKSKPTTIKDIVQTLNVSFSTVSRVLNNNAGIDFAMRQNIKTVARELNYGPNQTAILLQKGCTQTTGVILLQLSEAFFSSAIVNHTFQITLKKALINVSKYS